MLCSVGYVVCDRNKNSNDLTYIITMMYMNKFSRQID